MALPVNINKAVPAGSDLASIYDDSLRALKLALQDLFIIPDATDITAAVAEIIAAGLKNIRFADAAAGPTVAGALQRSGKALLFHSSERAIDLVPAGIILPYGGATVPTGWLLCDGQEVSRTTFAALFAAISTSYGAGDGSTTFNVPNLKGRVPVGLDAAQTEFDVLGETGGAKTHVHDMTHTHNFNRSPQSGEATLCVTDASVTHTGNTGSGSSLQPYVIVNYIIKT